MSVSSYLDYILSNLFCNVSLWRINSPVSMLFTLKSKLPSLKKVCCCQSMRFILFSYIFLSVLHHLSTANYKLCLNIHIYKAKYEFTIGKQPVIHAAMSAICFVVYHDYHLMDFIHPTSGSCACLSFRCVLKDLWIIRGCQRHRC